MKNGIQDGRFYVDVTSCKRPIGNFRQELELKCRELSVNNKIMISLSGGLDSQLLLHTFASQGLPYRCAFLLHPGFNDNEYENVKILEKKYGFNSHIVTLDPIQIKEEIESLSKISGVVPQFHIKDIFFNLLPAEYSILEGYEPTEMFLKNGRWTIIESRFGIDLPATWFYKNRKVIQIDRRGDGDELHLSVITDDVVESYRYSYNYIKHNGLIESSTYQPPMLSLYSWDYYTKPMLYGKYWKDEIIYFPKFAVQREIEYLLDPKTRLDYTTQVVHIDLEEAIDIFSDFGSGRTKRFWQQDQ
jgi:hypothetical protein